MNTEYLKGLILTTLGVVVLSFDALLIRLIGAEAFDVLFWRGLLLSVAILLWYRFSPSGKKQTAVPREKVISWDAPTIRSALLFTGSSISFVMALHLTSVANTLVIISAQPLFAALMSRVFLGERSAPVTWVAIFLSMAGIAWVLAGSWQSENLTGDFCALLAGLFLSAKFVNDRAAKRNMTPGLIMSGFLVAAISFIAGQPFSLQGDAWIWIGVLCLVVLPLAYTLITIGPMRISAAEVGMLMLLETALGPLWTWIWLSEVPGRAALEGGAVVILTLLGHSLIQWKRSVKKVN